MIISGNINRRKLAGVGAGLFLLFVALATTAQEGDPAFGKMSRLTWAPPINGTPVHHYLVQVMTTGMAAADTVRYDNVYDTHLDVFVEYGMMYRARIAAVDSLGRQGDFSHFTPMYGPR